MTSRNRLMNNQITKPLSADGNYMGAKKEAIPAEGKYYRWRNNQCEGTDKSAIASSKS